MWIRFGRLGFSHFIHQSLILDILAQVPWPKIASLLLWRVHIALLFSSRGTTSGRCNSWHHVDIHIAGRCSKSCIWEVLQDPLVSTACFSRSHFSLCLSSCFVPTALLTLQNFGASFLMRKRGVSCPLPVLEAASNSSFFSSFPGCLGQVWCFDEVLLFSPGVMTLTSWFVASSSSCAVLLFLALSCKDMGPNLFKFEPFKIPFCALVEPFGKGFFLEVCPFPFGKGFFLELCPFPKGALDVLFPKVGLDEADRLPFPKVFWPLPKGFFTCPFARVPFMAFIVFSHGYFFTGSNLCQMACWDISIEHIFSPPARWGLLDFNIALRDARLRLLSRLLLFLFSSSPPHQLLIAVGTAGPQPPPPDPSAHSWNSTAWALLDPR